MNQLNVVDRDCGIQEWMSPNAKPLDCYYCEYDTSPQAPSLILFSELALHSHNEPVAPQMRLYCLTSSVALGST